MASYQEFEMRIARLERALEYTMRAIPVAVSNNSVLDPKIVRMNLLDLYRMSMAVGEAAPPPIAEPTPEVNENASNSASESPAGSNS